MDNKTKAALGLSGASTLGQVALQLSDYHNPSLAILLALTMIAPAAYAGWHGINVWREQKGKQSLQLEPWHLITLGLLIAIGGLAWQQWWWRPTTNLAGTAAPVSGAPSAGVASQLLQPAKFYSQQDKENLSNLCRELRELFVRNGGDGVATGFISRPQNWGMTSTNKARM